MADGIEAALAVVLFAGAIGAAQAPGGGLRSAHGRPPVATIGALVVVGVPTVLQLTVWPELLGALERSPEAVSDGQVWRLVTSLVVQDGGASGAAANLVALAVVGVAAERVWGARRWIVIALASGVGGELWGLLVQPTGGGNSVVVFGVASSLAAAAARRGGRARAPAAISLLAGAVLLAAGSVHGAAAAVGALAGVVLTSPAPRLAGAGALTPPR